MPTDSSQISLGGRKVELLITVLLLPALACYGIIKKTKPQNPPIENMEEHLKIIQSLPNQKARQKYLKDITK